MTENLHETDPAAGLIDCLHNSTPGGLFTVEHPR
jgi:hypothetical protein